MSNFEPIYLDHAATTALLPGARFAMSQAFEQFGNPSSLHWHGRRGKDILDVAREAVSSALGCLFAEVVFTSGGTEAANLALVGAALANTDSSRRRVLLSSIEHPCVLNSASLLRRLGYEVEFLPVDRSSFLDVSRLAELLGPDVLMVSLMSANNETGAVQPVASVVERAHAVGALVHCDHVQGFLKPVPSPVVLGADLVTVSAHKVGGPKGCGALAVLNGTKVSPLVAGGEQERELRGGTENVIGVAGFGAAVSEFAAGDLAGMKSLLVDTLSACGAVFTCADSLSSHIHFRIPGMDAETLLIRLDMEGICASSGSACSSGSVEASHVMLACGYSEGEAKEAVRFSLGHENDLDQIERACGILRRVLGG
jgi:cysteine desulfurase